MVKITNKGLQRKLKQAMKNGVNFRELAKACDLNYVILIELKNGKRKVSSIQTLERLLNGLGCEIGDILEVNRK